MIPPSILSRTDNKAHGGAAALPAEGMGTGNPDARIAFIRFKWELAHLAAVCPPLRLFLFCFPAFI